MLNFKEICSIDMKPGILFLFDENGDEFNSWNKIPSMVMISD